MAFKLFVIFGLVAATSARTYLRERYAWTSLDWDFPDASSRQDALLSGAFVPENALPVGIERWQSKLFVSVPRWRAGIPATLNYIDLTETYVPSPKLIPYPSWEGNELGNCQTGLNTVYRIKADKCDRLWVLDVGTFGYDPNVTNVCPYSLNIYDLKTDRRIRRYVFRPEDIVGTTFIANIALDEGNTCDDTFAYFSDELGYGLIAYSWEQNKSWRFSHNFYRPDPLVGKFNIAGLTFDWGAEGIFGISASAPGNDGYRDLYFSPLTSYTEFSISTRILRNESMASSTLNDIKIVGSRGDNTHTTAKVIDEDSGVQLYSLIDQNAIGCWNINKPLRPQTTSLVDKEDVALVFPSDIKIDSDKVVWVISDRMPVFLEANLDYSDINFRIFSAYLPDLVEETPCEIPKTPKLSERPAPALSPINPQVLKSSNYVSTPQFNSVPYLTHTQRIPQRSTTRINFEPKIESFINMPQQLSIPYYTDRKGKQYHLKKVSSSYPITSPEVLPQKPWWMRGSYEVTE